MAWRTCYIYIMGGYYGILIILSNAINIFRGKKIRRYKRLSVIFTFIIVCFGYIFFNSSSVYDAFGMIQHIFSGPLLSLSVIKNLGVQFYKQVGAAIYFAITVASVLLFIIVDFLVYKGISVHQWIVSRGKMFKYILSAAIVLFLFLMMNRSSGDFTYMQF